MQCKLCERFMSGLEVHLFKDECGECVTGIDNEPIVFSDIPNHGLIPVTDKSDDTFVKPLSADKIRIQGIYSKDVLDAFKEKAPSEPKLLHKNVNIGASNYADFKIQPWDIWREYGLNPWDADIIKRILRTKVLTGVSKTDARLEDYEKIKHICDERIAQLKGDYND